MPEIEEVLDILARQPANARHISGEIATYFVADNPPPALVDRMTQTFQHTDGDIAAVWRRYSTRRNSPPRPVRSSRIRCITCCRRCGLLTMISRSSTPLRFKVG